MSKASKTFVEVERKRDPESPLLKALVEMSAFEQALGKSTSFYHYPLNGTLHRAKRKNLIRERDGLVRLTAWGREVASAA